MKYDRRQIMRNAWYRYKNNRYFHGTFADALHLEWISAKAEAARYDVWGDSFTADRAVLLASCVGREQAAREQESWKYQYDFVEIRQAGYDYQNHRRTAWAA